LKPPDGLVLAADGVLERLGEDHIHESVHEAVVAALEAMDNQVTPDQSAPPGAKA
jgi:hypothetical protein